MINCLTDENLLKFMYLTNISVPKQVITELHIKANETFIADLLKKQAAVILSYHDFQKTLHNKKLSKSQKEAIIEIRMKTLLIHLHSLIERFNSAQGDFKKRCPKITGILAKNGELIRHLRNESGHGDDFDSLFIGPYFKNLYDTKSKTAKNVEEILSIFIENIWKDLTGFREFIQND